MPVYHDENCVEFNLKDAVIHFIPKNYDLKIKKIISNPEKLTTVVLWGDGTKTIVKRSLDDPNDIYFAVASAIAIKTFGSNSAFKSQIDKHLVIHSSNPDKSDQKITRAQMSDLYMDALAYKFDKSLKQVKKRLNSLLLEEKNATETKTEESSDI